MGMRDMATERTVYVVDDDPAIRESLAILLKTAGIEGRVFETAEEFLAALKDNEPICALVDVFLPGIDGLSLQRRLADRGIEAALILMTGQADVTMAVQAMRAGAMHFVEKPFDPNDLLGAINDAVQHQSELEELHAKRAETERVLNSLTPREREVFSLLMEGHPNKVVAALLGISTRTAEHHRSNIMAKMKVRTLPQLARMSAGFMNLPRDSIGRTTDFQHTSRLLNKGERRPSPE
jgi:RNA polymerase sigma factor (sigma-70 family)